MHLYYRNVNDALRGIVKGFQTNAFKSSHPDRPVTFLPPLSRSPSRNGEVLVIEEPVTITYTHPLERVLFNLARDANPFFHAIESLWMLAGRNDLEPLVHFNKEMAKFSDDNKLLWGAYGYRWRNAAPQNEMPYCDQLNLCIEVLKDKATRRCVLQMWHPEDLVHVAHDPAVKDVPCNTQVMFLPRKACKVTHDRHHLPECHVLDMTVINRSNDMLLGSLGANYVHFSFLHEYIALAVGMVVGRYNQISNNLHLYISPLYISPKEDGADWLPMKCQPEALLADAHGGYTPGYEKEHIQLYHNRAQFDSGVSYFFKNRMWRAETIQDFATPMQEWRSPFMILVAIPMVLAFNAHKRRDYNGATLHCKEIKAADWYIASINWLAKREGNYHREKDDGVI